MLLQTWGIIRSRARKNPVLARNPPGTKKMDPPSNSGVCGDAVCGDAVCGDHVMPVWELVLTNESCRLSYVHMSAYIIVAFPASSSCPYQPSPCFSSLYLPAPWALYHCTACVLRSFCAVCSDPLYFFFLHHHLSRVKVCTMSRKPSVHLMPEGYQDELERREWSISGLSGLSVTSSASEFLETKIQSQNLELEYLRMYSHGLQAARATGSLQDSEFTDQIGPVLDEFTGIKSKLQVLKHHWNSWKRTSKEEAHAAKDQQLAHDEPDITFLEQAYANSMVPRVMNASNHIQVQPECA